MVRSWHFWEGIFPISRDTDAAFIIGTGIALWFATANPFLGQIANLPK